MSRITFILLLVANLTIHGLIPVFAGDNSAMSEMAEEAYRNGDMISAKNIYNKLIEEGEENSDLQYNLGNCFFRLKDYPSAILHYEKALKINPSNYDARFNLNVANTFIKDDITPLPEFFVKRWWNTATGIFSSSGWTLLHVIFFMLFLCSLALFLITRRERLKKTGFWSAGTFLVISIFFLLFAISKNKYEENHSEAIIFSSTVTVKSSPGISSTNLSELHAGTKVVITDKVEEWVEIKTADGNVGWIYESDLEMI